jgi:hypothetical protein
MSIERGREHIRTSSVEIPDEMIAMSIKELTTKFQEK